MKNINPLAIVPPPSRRFQLRDQYGRSITYLRLSVTDRCNLRCRYCMPAHGLPGNPREEILSWEELDRIVRIFTALGIIKVRITGGEPFSRKGIIPFLQRIRRIPGVEELLITTNGVGLADKIPRLKESGISGVNLSLDTLHRERFRKLTHRDAFVQVIQSFHRLMKENIPVKLNCVILAGFNTDEIAQLARLAEAHPIEVRFIEEMPFLSQSGSFQSGWDFLRIFTALRERFPGILPLPFEGGTAKRFQVPGFRGKIGIIAGHSRLFCSTCNRVRVTAVGQFKTCLYDRGVLDLRALLRSGADDEEICTAIRTCVQNRFVDGHEAYARSSGKRNQSMAQVGG